MLLCCVQLTALCDRDKFSIDAKSTKLQIDPMWFNYLQVCYSHTSHSTHDSPLTFLSGKVAGRACWLIMHIMSCSEVYIVLRAVLIAKSSRQLTKSKTQIPINA